MAKGLAKRIGSWISRRIQNFISSPSSNTAADGGACCNVPPAADIPDGSLIFEDKKNKIMVAVPVVCKGYLPIEVQAICTLRAAGLSEATIRMIIDQKPNWKYN